MAARTAQLGKVVAAAQWLEARNAEVMESGFTLQQVTVHVQLDGTSDPLERASVTFTWADDHYNFTVA